MQNHQTLTEWMWEVNSVTQVICTHTSTRGLLPRGSTRCSNGFGLINLQKGEKFSLKWRCCFLLLVYVFFLLVRATRMQISPDEMRYCNNMEQICKCGKKIIHVTCFSISVGCFQVICCQQPEGQSLCGVKPVQKLDRKSPVQKRCPLRVSAHVSFFLCVSIVICTYNNGALYSNCPMTCVTL